MAIDLRYLETSVPKELTHDVKTDPLLNKIGREGMSQRMQRQSGGQLRPMDQSLELP